MKNRLQLKPFSLFVEPQDCLVQFHFGRITIATLPHPCAKVFGVALSVAFVIATATVQTAAATIHVGGPNAQFQSVQLAIDSAHPGDMVEVHSGTYTGNLKLNKQITLMGMDRPTLRGVGNDSVITVLAEGCVIRGFIIEHSGGELTREDSGILLK